MDRTSLLKLLCQIGTLFMAVLMFAGCDGGNKDDKVNHGWVTVNCPTASNQCTSDADTIRLSGTAFVSPIGSNLDYDWNNYRYIGNTGVTVTWKNETTGLAGSASVGFDLCYGGYDFYPLLSLCNSAWDADIPLVMGANFITVAARDGWGNEGVDSITVARVIDVTQPLVSSTNPASGAVEVPGGASISATFSEAMDPSSLNESTFLLSDAGNNRVAGTVTAAGATATFTPAAHLAANMKYTASLTTGARDRAGGNFLQTEYTWSFTVDSIQPQIAGAAPQGFEVALNSVMSVNFREDMDPAMISAGSFIVKDGNNSPVAGTVAYSSKKATFTPTNGLHNSEVYTATITTAVVDLAGNPLSSDYSWTFYTKALETGSWQPILPPNYTTYRWHVTTAWTDRELIILDTICPGKYDYVSRTWGDISTAGAPTVALSKAVWTGTDVITWGGYDGTSYLSTGGRYNPATDTWKQVSLLGVPSARNGQAAVWTGTEMINWGGYDGTSYLNTGGGYNPATDTWKQVSLLGAPSARNGQAAVWTGSEMLVWGGYDGTNYLQSGGRYDPVNDTWRTISLLGAPAPRNGHTAVWTGSEMIVWGGYDGTNYMNTGGRYNPVTDTWKEVSLLGAPSPRNGHSAIWSGFEMIIWGGDANRFPLFDTGGLYNPATNIWSATSGTSAPEARTGHTATWIGLKMLIWGGLDRIYYNNTGGEFTP